MAEPRNETSWEQGFVLSAAGADKLGLSHPEAEGEAVVVLISHDCDLVENSVVEPSCEVIVGQKIESINGAFANGKNPRRLHLKFSAGATSIQVELLARQKRSISKDALLIEAPMPDLRLSQDELFTLQSWLASRYHRPVFADEFDRRLKERPADVHKKVANAIKATGSDLIAVLFDIDSGRNETHEGPDDPYSLEMLLVYNVSEDPGRALATANRAASTIRDIFRRYYFSEGRWRNIELRGCVPVSADSLTLYQFRSTKPWHFDYLEIVEG